MKLVASVHGSYIHTRRVRVLCAHFASVIPQNARMLDVGCGDGLLAHLIEQCRPDVSISGIDVAVRDHTHIPVALFDGQTIPYDDASYDVVMLVDVLHHTEDPMILLREAARVARSNIVIKDHVLQGMLAGPTLRLMDRVGNARYGVALPYNYWPLSEWRTAFETLAVTAGIWNDVPDLYPKPLNWLFGRSLHYIARLDIRR
jgi:SAM-dependent methyltransferase